MTLSGRPVPRLMVITDLTRIAEPELEERIRVVLESAAPGSVMVELRDKALSARHRLALGRRISVACRRYEQWFIVADRLDIAVLSEADGVHLGEASVSAVDARRLLPAGAWVSRACHDTERTPEPGIDAVVLSPVADARKGRMALGVEGVRRARRTLASGITDRPVSLYALGGIDAENAGAYLAAGADGVAVIGAVFGDREPLPLLSALGIAR